MTTRINSSTVTSMVAIGQLKTRNLISRHKR